MLSEVITTISWSILSFISSVFSFGSDVSTNQLKLKSPVASPSAYIKNNELENPLEVEYSGIKYEAYWVKVDDLERVGLFPNFKEKLTSSEIINLKNCKALVSGSFYSKDNKPLGLFVSQGWKTANAYFNPLLNGFFSILGGTPSIRSQKPSGNVNTAVQSGPILVEDGKAKSLKIKNDKTARRVTVSLSNAHEIIFAVFYDPQNNLQGPYLSDLPKYVQDFSAGSGLKIESSLNLDGGSASAFYDGKFFLPEFNPIGSYFCIR
jgi:uncharacterized protein YigE (DUF2233 family)